MSFSFQWPRFSPQFHTDAIAMLNAALNKGTKPPVIADRIEVVELEMGTQPPELEIRDIGDLTTDQFRGIFRLTYAGDAHIVLRTKVQANPLNHKAPDIHGLAGSRGMLAAKSALVVPMLLRLSHFELASYVVLVVSRQKGITLVFKTDPLQNVDIGGTFDGIAVIQNFIQREIEGQLRQMFREDLPGIIHRLSQQWFKAKVEPPLHVPRPPPPTPAVTHQPLPLPARATSYAPSSRASSVHTPSLPRRVSQPIPPPLPPTDAPDSSFPDIENFDPTYGLRPGALPAKSVFGAFGRLFTTPARGLADLAEEPAPSEAGTDAESYSVAEWEELVPDYTSYAPEYESVRDYASAQSPSELGPDDLEYETLPAVGGGTITRPRVFHAQSAAHAPAGVALTPAARAPSRAASAYGALPRLNTASRVPSAYGALSGLTPGGLAHRQYNPYFPPMGVTPPSGSTPSVGLYAPPARQPSVPPTPPLYRSPPRRARSPAPSTHTHPSASSSHTHAPPTPPASEPAAPDDAFHSHSGWPGPSDSDGDADEEAARGARKIVLRPSALPRLSTLAHSNHTLSPYTRVPEHFAVRTGAPAAAPPPAAPVRARRKRLHTLGGAKGKAKASPRAEAEELRRTGSTSPAPPSSEMADDMDRYFFRAGDAEGGGEAFGRQVPHAWPPDGGAGLRLRAGALGRAL